MVNLVFGITITEGNKTLLVIYNKVTCNRHRSNGLRFDDTLSKKDTSTKSIEGLNFHNSHTDGNKPIWSHCLVISHYKINDYYIPLEL